jgi:chitin synthase
LAGNLADLKQLYFGMAITYAIVMFFSIVLGAWLVYVNALTIFVWVGLVAAVFAYLIAGLIHGHFFAVAIVFVQYLLFIPIYYNMFSIYSFCNMHDVSW